jgi:hypothetical protein
MCLRIIEKCVQKFLLENLKRRYFCEVVALMENNIKV